MKGIKNQKDLIIEMIDALRACESELDAINNSELINKINELLGRTSSLTGILNEESLNELVVCVKEDNEPISEEDMEDLLMMFGH